MATLHEARRYHLSDLASVEVVDVGAPEPVVSLRVRIAATDVGRVERAVRDAIDRVRRTEAPEGAFTAVVNDDRVAPMSVRVLVPQQPDLEVKLRDVLGSMGWAPVRGQPVAKWTLDRGRAAALGVPMSELALSLRAALDGVPCGPIGFSTSQRSRPLVLRLRGTEATATGGDESKAVLSAAVVGPDHRLIPLRELVRRDTSAAGELADRYRVDGRSVAAFDGRLRPTTDLREVEKAVREKLGADTVVVVPDVPSDNYIDAPTTTTSAHLLEVSPS